ncbi:MAG TPA: HEAT repeat domain-containing protein, partial [Desulfuromonadales bacterium]|nr:HEAT repeat domain-containing protein [Desulfuromonadales bacterium]
MEDKQRCASHLTPALEEERLQTLRTLASGGNDGPFPALWDALGDESWRIRKEAGEIFLGLPGAGEHVGTVVQLLHAQENAGLRNAAVEILVRLGRQAVPALLAELSCEEADVRKFVLDILGAIGDSASVPAMIGSLRDPDSNVRAAAAENLGRIGAEEAVLPLLDAMSEPDILFRYTILEALGQIGAPIPAARLLVYRDESLLKKALFDCLGRIGGAEALATLIEGLSERMANVREAALVAISNLGRSFREEAVEALDNGGASAADSIAAFLDAPDPQLRQVAIQVLGLMGDGRFVSRLLGMLDVEDLREAALQALIALSRRHPESLVRHWEKSDLRTRTYLAYLFGEMEDSESSRVLLRKGVSSADPDLRLMCARSLGKLGDLAALPKLISFLQDETDEMRDAVLSALVALGTHHRDEVLESLQPLEDHADPGLRSCRVIILGRLDG